MEQVQKLEEKVSKIVEIFRRTQAENRSLLQQIEKLRTDSRDSIHQKEQFEREVQMLRREREDVRARVEKLLEQVEALTKQDSAG
ncbi:MAG: hypothetical protein ACRD2B_08730 [Terriglobia bacterium]